ncbi:hypothetical protein BHE74_00036976 [Ensete ventricosum]|nr:hypothetical protein BHE74_00036976 [Ensete ventricosum]
MTMNLKEGIRRVVNYGEDLTVVDFDGDVSLAEKEQTILLEPSLKIRLDWTIMPPQDQAPVKDTNLEPISRLPWKRALVCFSEYVLDDGGASHMSWMMEGTQPATGSEETSVAGGVAIEGEDEEGAVVKVCFPFFPDFRIRKGSAHSCLSQADAGGSSKGWQPRQRCQQRRRGKWCRRGRLEPSGLHRSLDLFEMTKGQRNCRGRGGWCHRKMRRGAVDGNRGGCRGGDGWGDRQWGLRLEANRRKREGETMTLWLAASLISAEEEEMRAAREVLQS